MTRKDTNNTFDLGLTMDFNPLVTPDNVLTNCLNGTLLTYNGNENVLLNDMGNGRVETAYLPEGYVPVGTAELGGIIYIVSYNPLIDKCLIGCFPSPERNITSDEVLVPEISVEDSNFVLDGKVINTLLKVKLLSNSNSEDGIFKVNPGDKYTIFSTNNGITNNKLVISDVLDGSIKTSKGNHKVDSFPKVLTIHVVSIGDDGKITYLDDSLKWSNEDLDYYIKELSNDTKDKNAYQLDLDSYRTLVSTAYNVFNSKISGELALLFELKVIDTFSVTWDADVTSCEDKEDYDKTASILFYINYTSPHSNVNLAHIIISDSHLQGDVESRLDNLKGQHYSFENISGRKNDGSDNSLLTSAILFDYSSDEISSCTWNYAITPAMKFGYLDYLTQRGFINFLEIGSGKIELDEWRYYILNNDFYLNWGLSAYPEKNKKIDKVVMTFIPFSEITGSSISNLESKISLNASIEYPQYEITGKVSYSGYFQELIPFNTANDKLSKPLIPNSLYLVDICVHYSGEYRHNYRWLYTTGLWNKVFEEGTETDFNNIFLDDVLTFGKNVAVKDNIDKQTDVYTSPHILPEEYNKEELPYAFAGALITAVNYNPESNSFITNALDSFEVGVTPVCTSYPDLFKFNKGVNNAYTYTLVKTSITHDEFIPKSDTKASPISYLVVSSVVEEENGKVSVPSSLASTVSDIIQNRVTATNDVNAKDAFTASNPIPTESGFNVGIYGAIFSRINADIDIKSMPVGLIVRPMLYKEGDFENLGLMWDTVPKFASIYKEDHWDGGGGKPFSFKFSNLAKGFEIESVKSVDDDAENQVLWDPNDKWERDYWWQIPPYTLGLNPLLLSENGAFQVVLYSTNNNTKIGNGAKSKSLYNLWVRTDEEHFVPIDEVSSNPDNLADKVANLYALLYYVSSDTTNLDLPAVTNINYITDYSEIWNTEVDIELSTPNILTNIVLADSNISLYKLKMTLLNSGVLLNNISYENPPSSLLLGNQELSHAFYIRNVELYNEYDALKATLIPSILIPKINKEGVKEVWTSKDDNNWVRILPKSDNIIWVRDGDDLVPLNSSNSKCIKYDGTFGIENSSSTRDIKFTKGITGISNTERSLYDLFSPRGLNDIKFNLSKLIGNKMSIKFQTLADGNPWSTVKNNSKYKLN